MVLITQLILVMHRVPPRKCYRLDDLQIYLTEQAQLGGGLLYLLWIAVR